MIALFLIFFMFLFYLFIYLIFKCRSIKGVECVNSQYIDALIAYSLNNLNRWFILNLVHDKG